MENFTEEQLKNIIAVFRNLKWSGDEWDQIVTPILNVANSQIIELSETIAKSEQLENKP